jgi:hypothetical protein
MDLVMLIGDNVVDFVVLEEDKISTPGYLSGITRMLKEQNGDLLVGSAIEPEFLLRNEQQA